MLVFPSTFCTCVLFPLRAVLYADCLNRKLNLTLAGDLDPRAHSLHIHFGNLSGFVNFDSDTKRKGFFFFFFCHVFSTVPGSCYSFCTSLLYAPPGSFSCVIVIVIAAKILYSDDFGSSEIISTFQHFLSWRIIP